MIDHNNNTFGFIDGIRVLLISPDPYFLTGNQSLIGRDRYSRVSDALPTTKELNIAKYFEEIEKIGEDVPQVMVIDFGYTGRYRDAEFVLQELRETGPHVRVIGFVDQDNDKDDIQALLDNIHMDALLYKHEVGPTTHLIIQAVFKSERWLVTPQIWKTFITKHDTAYKEQFLQLDLESPWKRELEKVGLSKRLVDVFVLRVIAGIDRPDISNELGIELTSVDSHTRRILKLFGIVAGGSAPETTLRMFEKISEHWWETRFLPTI